MNSNGFIYEELLWEEDDAGFQLCKRLKNDPSTVNILVLILTKRTLSTDFLEGKRVGADDYLGKPYSPYELRQKVQGMLER